MLLPGGVSQMSSTRPAGQFSTFTQCHGLPRGNWIWTCRFYLTSWLEGRELPCFEMFSVLLLFVLKRRDVRTAGRGTAPGLGMMSSPIKFLAVTKSHCVPNLQIMMWIRSPCELEWNSFALTATDIDMSLDLLLSIEPLEAPSANGDTQSYAAGFLEGALTHTRSARETREFFMWLLRFCTCDMSGNTYRLSCSHIMFSYFFRPRRTCHHLGIDRWVMKKSFVLRPWCTLYKSKHSIYDVIWSVRIRLGGRTWLILSTCSCTTTGTVYTKNLRSQF